VETILVDLRPGGSFKTLIVNDATGATYATDAVLSTPEAASISLQTWDVRLSTSPAPGLTVASPNSHNDNRGA